MRSYRRDEHRTTAQHWLAEKNKTHTHALASVGLMSIGYNPEALTTRDNKGETPHDIALRSGACAKIKDLLSLTLQGEEVHSLGLEMLYRIFAPVADWRGEMVVGIYNRSYADCHKFINEHDDELVREVLKSCNSDLLRAITNSQEYSSDSSKCSSYSCLADSQLTKTNCPIAPTAAEYACTAAATPAANALPQLPTAAASSTTTKQQRKLQNLVQ